MFENKLVAFLGCAVIFAVGYYIYKKNTHKSVSVEKETVDKLSMEDIVSIFKLLHLEQDKDIPFIADSNWIENQIKNLQNNASSEEHKDYKKLYIGVMDKTSNEIKNFKLYFVKELVVPEKIMNELEKSGVVVLK